jgi:ABC-type transport system involved in Fe-S cluster assembly fused permease/ATPase subunit
MNWESVKYFTSERRESARYAKAINEYQTVELKVIGSLNALNLVQNAIITTGLLAGSLIESLKDEHLQRNLSSF